MKYTIFTIICALSMTGCSGSTQNQIVHIADELALSAPTATTTIKQEQGSSTVASQTPSEPQKASTTRPISIPAHLMLPVLFAQQAPFGNWDEVHQEACEEASMIIADSYFAQEDLDEYSMETKIQAFIAWQQKHGYAVDLSAQEMVDAFQSYFKRASHLTTEVTIDRIKYELAQGNLVIAPTAGRQLHNPNFKQPGPIYHVVVIVGYDRDGFIVHDVGTRKGRNYHYSFDILIHAIHDWDHQLAEGGMTDEEMARGRAVLIVVPATH